MSNLIVRKEEALLNSIAGIQSMDNEVFIISEKLEIHPAALIMPPMGEDEFKEFKEDISGNGLLEPIILFQGKVLDGRNRYNACQELGIEIFAQNWEGGMDPVEYVVSKNIHRRQLTPGQRAMAAERALNFYAEEAKERQRDSGGDRKSEEYKKSVVEPVPQPKPEPDTKARDKAGEMFDVSGRSVSSAKYVREHGTEEEVNTVETGKAPLKTVEKQVRERVTQAPKKDHKPQFNLTNDNIEWAKWTWNPVTGCKHGCPYCYARDIAKRFFDHGFEPHFYPERLSAPENTKVPPKEGIGWKNVFTVSMGDLFGEWVSQEWIDQIINVVSQNNQWNFLFLTKNPLRLPTIKWPVNAWVGATVDCMDRVSQTCAAFKKMYEENNKPNVSYISFEPLKERITMDLTYFDWVIIGGQSKTTNETAGQPLWEWVEDLHNQARAANCAIYWKPNLAVRPKEYPE